MTPSAGSAVPSGFVSAGGSLVLCDPEALPVVPVDTALRLLAPLRPGDPSVLAEAIRIYMGKMLPLRDQWARARWTSIQPFLRPDRFTSEGALPRPHVWSREMAGRWHCSGPALQSIPGAIRFAFRPAPGHVFIDADFSSAHLHVAATRACDGALLRALQTGDVYADWAERARQAVEIQCPRWVGCDPERMRAAVKRIFLAYINGAGSNRIATILADGALRPALPGVQYHAERHVTLISAPAHSEAAQPLEGDDGLSVRMVGPRVMDVAPLVPFLIARIQDEYRGLAQLLGTLRTLYATYPGHTFPVPSLTGSIRQIETVEPLSDYSPASVRRWQRDLRGGFRTLLSSSWSIVEAEAMDRILERAHVALAPYGGAPVLPLFDGILVQAREEHAQLASIALQLLMSWAMTKAGAPGVRVKTKILPTWGG